MGPARQRPTTRLGIVVRRPTIRARAVPGQLPHPVPRADPAGIADIPGEKIFFLQLADAPLHGHGRPPVEPPLPALPRSGRVRPPRLLGSCWARGTAGRCRWKSSTTSSASPTPGAPPSTPCARCWRCSRRVPCSAPPARLRTLRPPPALPGSPSPNWPPRRVRLRRGLLAALGSPTTGSTGQARRSVGAGRGPGPAQRPSATGDGEAA